MNSPIHLLMAVGGGGVLGAFFFGGLWWTVRRGLHSTTPALWFLGSLLVRTGTVVGGLLWMAGGEWQWLVAGLAGFFCVRLVAQCVSRTPRVDEPLLAPKITPQAAMLPKAAVAPEATP